MLKANYKITPNKKRGIKLNQEEKIKKKKIANPLYRINN